MKERKMRERGMRERGMRERGKRGIEVERSFKRTPDRNRNVLMASVIEFTSGR